MKNNRTEYIKEGKKRIKNAKSRKEAALIKMSMKRKLFENNRRLF